MRWGQSEIEPLEPRRLLSSATIVWQTAANSPLTRAEGSKAVVNGKMYVVGGFIDSDLHVTKELDRYDPASNTWTRLADCPVPETHGATAVEGNDIYLAGFFFNNGITASNLVYKYDTSSNTWTQEPSLPGKRGAAGAAILGSELHVWGGLTGQTISAADHWALNLKDSSASWQTLAPLPQPLDHVGSLALRGELWSIGGFQNKEETDGNLNVVYRYNPTNNQWSTRGVAQLPEGLGHIGPDTTVAGDDIIIAGGQINDSFEHEITQVLEYDSATNQWVTLTPLPAQRKSAFCVYADGKLIVSGGNQPTAPFASNVTWTADFTPNDFPPDGATGAVSGTVFNDTNGNGRQDSGEVGMAGVTVYSDANNNGQLDAGAGEMATMTDANGDYTLSALPSGATIIRQVLPAGEKQTAPASGNGQSVIVGSSPISGEDFGEVAVDSGGGDGGDGGSNTPPTDPQGPDLTGTIRSPLAAQVIAGVKGRATITVVNDGAGPALGKFDIALAVSPDGLADDATPVATATGRKIHLKPGKHHDYLIHFQLPADLAGGNYTLLALLDKGNALVESNESNNTVSGPAVAVAAQVHNVAVTSWAAKPTLRANQPGRVRFQLLNTGNVVESGQVSLTISATPMNSPDAVDWATRLRHISIKAGKHRAFSIRFRVPAGLSGPFQLTATLTPVTLKDDNPADNAASGEVAIE